MESLSDGPFSLDTKAMIADIGDDMAPVLNTDYNLEDPIKGYIKIQEYIEEVGNKNIQTKHTN